MGMICEVMKGINGEKKNETKNLEMSFTVVSAMGKMSVVYPL